MKHVLLFLSVIAFFSLTAYQCELPAECTEECYQTCLDADYTLLEKTPGVFVFEFENGCSCQVTCLEKRKDETLDKADPLKLGLVLQTNSSSESYFYSDTVAIPPDVDPDPSILSNNELPADKVILVGPKSGLEQDKVYISIENVNYASVKDKYANQVQFAGNDYFTVVNPAGYFVTAYKTSDPDKVLRVGYASKERYLQRFSFRR